MNIRGLVTRCRVHVIFSAILLTGDVTLSYQAYAGENRGVNDRRCNRMKNFLLSVSNSRVTKGSVNDRESCPQLLETPVGCLTVGGVCVGICSRKNVKGKRKSKDVCLARLDLPSVCDSFGSSFYERCISFLRANTLFDLARK